MESIWPVFKWLDCPVLFNHLKTKLVGYSDPHCILVWCKHSTKQLLRKPIHSFFFTLFNNGNSLPVYLNPKRFSLVKWPNKIVGTNFFITFPSLALSVQKSFYFQYWKMNHQDSIYLAPTLWANETAQLEMALINPLLN